MSRVRMCNDGSGFTAAAKTDMGMNLVKWLQRSADR
jgi:hypothetical protein